MIFGIICIAISVSIFVLLGVWETKRPDVWIAGCFGAVACMFLYVGIDSLTHDITPMDVYQGKTTLKYEVVDGVKVDSTVVWKENTYEQD